MYPTQDPALFFTKPPIDVKASITETSLMRAACSAWRVPTFKLSSGAILEYLSLHHICENGKSKKKTLMNLHLNATCFLLGVFGQVAFVRVKSGEQTYVRPSNSKYIYIYLV